MFYINISISQSADFVSDRVVCKALGSVKGQGDNGFKVQPRVADLRFF